MAWFWNSGNEEEDEEESYYEEEDDDEYDSEFTEEDFAEEEDDEEDEYSEDPPEDDENDHLRTEKEPVVRTEEGIIRTKPMDRGDDEECENDLLEEEFAQLVGDANLSRSAAATSGTIIDESSKPTEHDASLDSIKNTSAVPQETTAIEPQEQASDQQTEEEVTTLEEKQSLMILAAEHDRVDILKAILAEPETKQQLLDGESLHIAISHGSVNAVNCLLRMGADPSIEEEGKTAWALALDNSKSMAPSKREGIRHAFTAEALRCIGADEVERLQQLIAAGLPPSCDIGGRSLAEWTVDLEAAQCQALVGASQSADNEQPNHASVVNRFHEEDLSALENRLDELNNLSKALSEFLDNLAEEVSVCSGLLLVGSGAAALAAHVKSLKQQKTKLMVDLERHVEALENSEDELAYWIRECGGVDILKTFGSRKEHQQASGSPTTEEQGEKQRVKTQIAACETKIRMLRASIADLSDENERNLLEVERRGLQGGVRLVRSLRNEIVDLEFQLSEINSGEAACRAKISLLQHHAKSTPNAILCETASAEPTGENDLQEAPGDKLSAEVSKYGDRPEDVTSTAIIVRPSGGSHGFLPFSIWQMLLRIMGLSSATPSSNRQAMIV